MEGVEDNDAGCDPNSPVPLLLSSINVTGILKP